MIFDINYKIFIGVSDGDCFFPLRSRDFSAFEREDLEEQLPLNLVKLVNSALPSELEGLLPGAPTDWQCWMTPEDQPKEESAAEKKSATAPGTRMFIVAGERRDDDDDICL